MIKTISFLVRGRVQGVGFRYWTQRQAEDLGLTGWVRNDPDGAVQGFARGQAARIDVFRDQLWRGPTYANVTHVLIDEIHGDQVPHLFCAGFEIRP